MDSLNINILEDMHLENKTLFLQFQQAMLNNDINSATSIMNNNPQLATQICSAENINSLIDGVSTMEGQIKIDIDNYLSNLLVVFQNLINQTRYISVYNPLIQYRKHNAVNYENKTYFAKEEPPVGTIPTNTTYWNEYDITGLDGYPGMNLTLRYNWSASVQYHIYDVVIYKNKLWLSLTENINSMPNYNFTDWFIISIPKVPKKIQITETEPTDLDIGDLWFKVVEGGSIVQDKWEYKESMTYPRYACRPFVNGTDLYILGGDDITTTRIDYNEKYDTLTNTWSTKAPMITPRGGFMTFVLNGMGYAIGGTHIYGDCLDVNEEYDFTTNTWSTKAPMPSPRMLSGFATNATQTEGYIFGGTDSNYLDTNKIYKYVQSTNTWSEIGTTPIYTQDAQAYNIGNKVYVYISTTGDTTTSFYVYDIDLGTWTKLADLLDYRLYGSLVASGNNVFVIGGLNSDWYTTNTNQIYDITENEWVYGVPMQITRLSAASRVIDDKIYICGGADLVQYNVSNLLEVYTI